MRNRCRRSLLAVIVLLGAAEGVATQALAQTFTEFPIPTANSGPTYITPGPDGALWFTEGSSNQIGRITTAGVVTEYPTPTANSSPFQITTGPDGALWFVEQSVNQIGRITTAGVITEFPLPGPDLPWGIATGPDGALWFTEVITSQVGRITTTGVVTEFPIYPPNNPDYSLYQITPGPDGALWFGGLAPNPPGVPPQQIGRITTAGVAAEFPGGYGIPYDITTGPDGTLWFAVSGGAIGSITTAGLVSEYYLPPPSSVLGITTGPDGALWFTDSGANQIGRSTTTGVITEFPIPTANSGAWGITTGPDGALWFTESGANKIGRLALTPATPEIVFNGANIANPVTPPPVLVGQQVSLTALLPASYGPVASQKWSITGTPIGGYTPTMDSFQSGNTLPVIDTNQSIQFYWYLPTSSRMTYQVVYSYRLTAGTMGTIATKFTVTPAPNPHVGFYEQRTGVNCVTNPTSCDLYYLRGSRQLQLQMGFGNPYVTTEPGMLIGTNTDPGSGAFQWVQLIVSDIINATNTGGKKISCTFSPGLDTYYPFPTSGLPPSDAKPFISFAPTFLASDIPSVPLTSSFISVGRSFKARTFLMWKSSITQSIPVPLGSLTWDFFESTRVDAKAPYGWTTPSITASPGAFSTQSPKYPVWKTLSQPNC